MNETVEDYEERSSVELAKNALQCYQCNVCSKAIFIKEQDLKLQDTGNPTSCSTWDISGGQFPKL